MLRTVSPVRTAGRIIGWAAATTAAAIALLVHQRVPWIPVWYLVALAALPAAVWWCVSCRRIRGAWRWTGTGIAAVAFLALTPVPWMKAQLDTPPGTAWQIDGQLTIDGDVVDPPGDWYWLTAGRPPVVAELVRSWLNGGSDSPRNMQSGRRAQRPAFVEPAAASVGLRRAGVPIELNVVVEVSGPTESNLPVRALVSTINGFALTDRLSWEHAVAGLHELNTFTTAGGDSFDFAGNVVPYRRVDVIDRPVGNLDVALGGRYADTLPVAWFRNLSVGSSHGLMIALVSYTYASGSDLAAGRTIAGTGGIRNDGTVAEIGELWSKATAARDIGADVMLYPASQSGDLAGFDPGGLQLFPVATLDDAIDALTTPAA